MENVVYKKNSPNSELSGFERVVFVLASSYLLYSSVKNKDALLALPAAIMAYRGFIGNCPATDRMGKSEVKKHNINVRTKLLIMKPVGEVYNFWRKLDNLPLFISHLESVTQSDGNFSHWIAKMPGGLGTVSWNAVIVNEKENEVLGWKSIEKSAVNHAGKVEFKTLGPTTTELIVVFSYRAPLGVIGENVARIFTPSFERVIRSDIEKYRDYVENPKA